MGLTRSDLLNPNYSDKDKAEIAAALANYEKNDEWALRSQGKIAILMTSHPGSRGFLKASVESWKKLGYWLVLAYDNHINPENDNPDFMMPAKDVMDIIDGFYLPKYQFWGGVLYPYFWQLKFGVALLQDFEYIICTNGDFIMEKAENFQLLFDRMGDADIMTCGPDRERACNTAVFIAKTTAFKAIMKHFEDHFIPLENYEKYTQEFGNAEGRLRKAIDGLKLKQVTVEPPCNDQLHVPGQGFWYETVGLRHIHGELNYAYRYKGIPPPSKYLDPRYINSNDIAVCKKYEETKDVSVLQDWYAK